MHYYLCMQNYFESVSNSPKLQPNKMTKFVLISMGLIVLSFFTIVQCKSVVEEAELELVLANGDVRTSPINQAQRRWPEGALPIAIAPVQDEIIQSTKIVSGRYARPGEAPYLVVVTFREFRQWCGGAIYNRDTIITAAHCFYYKMGKTPIPATDFVITAGEHDLLKQENTEMRRRGARAVIPDNYDPEEFPNDIAILKLEEPLRYTYYIQPIPLAQHGVEYANEVKIGGFGYVRQRQLRSTVYPKGFSSILKVAAVPERTKSECTEMFKGMTKMVALVKHETFYCAGGEAVEGVSPDACQGDSGGPVACLDENRQKHLCGIISTGYGCGLPGIPGIFTNVTYYLDWIRKHAGEPEPPTRMS